MVMAGSLASRLPRWAVIRNARRRHRRRLTRRALVLVALAALGAGLLTQRSTAGGSAAAGAAGPRLVDVGAGNVLGAQAAGNRVWVETCVALCGAGDTGLDRERLIELDAGSGAVLRRLPPQSNLAVFTIAGRAIWVAHFGSGDVARIDPVSGRVTASVRLRLPAPIVRNDRQFLPDSLSYAGGYVWASTERGWIAQIDARTGALVRMFRTPSQNNITAIDRQGTWVAEELDGVGLLAPHGKRIRIHTILQAGSPLDVYDVLNGGRTIWALASPDTTELNAEKVALSIDPRSDRVIHRVRVPTAESGAVVAGGALYLADLARGRIYRVSPDGTLATFSTPRHDAWLATASHGALWAATSVTPRQKHGQLFRISLPPG